MGDISPKGLDFIKRKEGYFDKAYLCPAGVWTIGWGSIRWSATQPVKKGDTCTQPVAEKLLLREIQRVEDAIDATITYPITQGMYDCCVSIFYNIGIGWLTGKGHQQATFVKYINKGELDKVPSELLKFSKATVNGKPTTVRGLLIRRQEEVKELWLADYEVDTPKASEPALVVNTDPAEAPMPQAVVPAAPGAVSAVASSTSGQASVFGIVATLLGSIFGVAKEAAPEALTNQQSLTGFNALFSYVGLNLGLLATIVTLATFGIVAYRAYARTKA